MKDSDLIGVLVICIFFAFLFAWQKINFLKEDLKLMEKEILQLKSEVLNLNYSIRNLKYKG